MQGVGDALKAVEKARLDPTVENLKAARDAMARPFPRGPPVRPPAWRRCARSFSPCATPAPRGSSPASPTRSARSTRLAPTLQKAHGR
ncbi:hypothetical protein G5V59_02485 [Nocardioides sp. W3-2-3]|uniref:hypothetical protein n=1 Tax=Nocardioides convexus TaxID=2712224 RepID=UPI00241866FE|nr:hypothetical protein [Nocardioides convexus]NGZ99620.1 hypothetical protein [Nocardioides convexus]